MHTSTRILLLLVALGLITGGWWLLWAINDLPLAIVYGTSWTVAVLISARILLSVGTGFNRLRSKRDRGPAGGPDGGSEAGPTDVAAALARLGELRDRELISAEEYEAKRATVIDRL